MKKIIKPRGTGKSKELLEYAKENNAVFVCHNPIMMRRKAQDYGIVGIDIIGYYDISDDEYRDRQVVIDELDLFVAAAAHKHLIGFNITSDD